VVGTGAQINMISRLRLRLPTATALESLGLMLIVVGAGMIYLPAAFIILGIGLLIASLGVPHDVSDQRDSNP